MRITFQVSGRPAEFHWSSWNGRADLKLGTEKVALQSPFAPSTHFSLSLVRIWRHEADGHSIEIQKDRPRMFPGVRSSVFTVRVDGRTVEQRTGR
jgi:hypothetical protein